MTDRERFEKAWANRPWLVEEESGKDRAWRWWQAAIASLEPPEERHGLPFHKETMVSLNSLTIRKDENTSQ